VVSALERSFSGYNRPMPKAKRTDEIFPRIRATIMKIPRGQVSSYGAIAAAAGFPRGARLTVRALSQAHGLPWHRVVAAGGRIAIPGEDGLDQRFRLEMEGVKFSGKKVRMAEFEFKFPKKGKQKKTAKKAASSKKKSRK
jgi:alkylated DNA nucleotide flippase Atl1